MVKLIKNDLSGERFTRLLVVSRAPNKGNLAMWNCVCDCGKERVVRGDSLKSGNTKSCGCYSADRARVHGFNGKNLEKVYTGMLARCYKPNHKSYPLYGGKGVKVCSDWLTSKDHNGRIKFFEWALNNGYELGLTLDRLDSNGNYEPDNCRWATQKQQIRNRCVTTRVVFRDKLLPLAEVVENHSGFHYDFVRDRLKAGWDLEKALTFPKKGGHSGKEYIVITGGLGFLGTSLSNYYLNSPKSPKIIIIDSKTYAADESKLSLGREKYDLYIEDIVQEGQIDQIFNSYKGRIKCIFHLAAESMVDKSIENIDNFVSSNIVGTQIIADKSLKYNIPLIYQSTDEIFGSLSDGEDPWNENSPILPRNPYAATKASGELLIRSYITTHKLRAKIFRSCNVFGPNQHEEKLIKKSIKLAMEGEPITLYPNGSQRREWVYQDDYCSAIDMIYKNLDSSEYIYNIYSNEDRSNREVVTAILNIVHNRNESFQYWLDSGKVVFKGDRPGHDYRYAMFGEKIRNLGWSPEISLEEGLKRTIKHYEETKS